jgi:TonB-linked SusC/RagA family outer membrane protein
MNQKPKTKLINCKLLLFTFVFFLGFYSNIQAQQITVKGIVTSADDGMPIPGVTVLHKTSKKIVVTNFDGEFAVQAKAGDIITVSYIGMITKNITVSGASMKVVLKSKAQDLDEVVVIGYGTVKKRELTGAVSSIKSEDIERIVSSDLGNALQGQLAGVNVVSNSGAPGSSSEILIRGVTSVNANNTPLYVVDGIIQEGDPGISPNEIQSIDVLKDAASTAIYGARGSTGVILITTKQGKAGALSVSTNFSYGIQHLYSQPTRLLDSNGSLYGQLIGFRNRTTLSDDEIDLIGLTAGKLRNNTNLYKYLIFDNQPIQNHSVTVSGGTKDFTYGVTTGYYKKSGTVLNSDFNRFNIRGNTKYNHGKWDIATNIFFTTEKTLTTDPNLISQILRYSPTSSDLNFPVADLTIENTGNNGADTNVTSYVLESFQNERELNTVKGGANISLGYELFKDFKITSRIGINAQNDFGVFFNPFQQIYDFFGTSFSPSTSSGVRNNATRKLNTVFETFINYKFNVQKNNTFTFTSGITSEKYNTQQFSASRNAVFNNDIKTISGTTGAGVTAGSGFDFEHLLRGFLLRFQYDYKGIYLLSSSIRRDESSNFAPGKNVGVFSTIAFAYNISDEKFFEPFKKVVSNMKLRATYGQTGNEGVTPYSYQNTINPNYAYAFNSNPITGAKSNGYANPNLQWETSIQSNFGLDLGLFKNKWNLSLEYYNKTNEDMLFPIVLPGSAGAGGNEQVQFNIGNMKNSGFELSSNYRGNIGKLKYRINNVFSTNKNVVTKINGDGGFTLTNDSGLIPNNGSFSLVTALAEGYEAGAFFIRRTNGIVNTNEKLTDYQKIRPDARLGDVIFVDVNKDGVIDDNDREYRGSGLPKFEVGFNFNLDYKGFDFSMNWYSAIGHEIMNGSKASAFAYGRHEDLLYQYSATNVQTPIPAYRGILTASDNFRGDSDLWLEKGDYIRLKQVSLGYSLSKKTMQSLGGLTKLRLYVSAQNPVTLTKYSGFDPEVGGNVRSRGLDKGNYPNTSFYLVGLNMNF